MLCSRFSVGRRGTWGAHGGRLYEAIRICWSEKTVRKVFLIVLNFAFLKNLAAPREVTLKI